jgi:teichuronic acid biosynthesis glycosyltransferase TuaC
VNATLNSTRTSSVPQLPIQGSLPNVLVISDLYPRPTQPVFGVFVEEQTQYLQPYCHQVVVSPLRTFPPLRIFRTLPSIKRFKNAWEQWRTEMDKTPSVTVRQGVSVYYPRYNSPPKQITYGIWGWFAYPFLLPLLRRLHDEHHFDLIHAHGAAPSGTLALLAKRWMEVPVVISEHGIDVQYIVHQNPVARTEVRSVFRKADAVLANSQSMVQDVIRHGADPRRVQLVYLGTHQGSEVVPNPIRPSNAPLQILSVARLVEEKGIQWVLYALRRLLDEGYSLRYTIVGEGEYRETLEALILRLGLTSQVEFAGSQLRSNILSYFAACDIFVLPSEPESFGIVYVEALSQGKPIIGCDISGASDLYSLYADGVELVRPKDVDSLIQSLRRLINDPARRQRVQYGAPALIKERFTWDRTAQETFAIYQKLLNRSALQTDGAVNASH